MSIRLIFYWRNTSGIVLYIVLKVIYLLFLLFFEETAQGRYQFDLELCVQQQFRNFDPLSETMGETGYDAYRYSYTAVIVFGILGNILIIVSILRQTNVLKNNYYFLVLQLAICNLGALIIYLLHVIFYNWLEEPLNKFNKFYCLGYNVSYIFQVAGIGMMLVISELRYRALCIP